MTDNAKCVCEQQMQNEINNLKKMFSVVRLLSAEDIKDKIGKCANSTNDGRYFEFWKRSVPCRNCIGYRSLVEKKQFSKIENSEDGLFLVFTDYREVDGKPCVIEAIKTLNEDFIIDFGKNDNPSEALSKYFDKTFKDVLTDTFNRRYYEEYIANEKISCGIAIIDIDDFKIYNDLFGHDVGDAVLKKVASVIKRSVRLDDKVIRYGGDEFLIITSGASEVPLERCMTYIRENVNKILFDEYPAIKLSISAGYIVCSGETVQECVSRADEFMYIAKKNKKNIVSDGENNDDANKKGKLLVVDDSSLNREILSSILKSEYDIVNAESGEQAIEILDKSGEDFSAVLLDLVMPGMSGFDVIDYLNCNTDGNLPIIAITGDDSGETKREAYEHGVSDYVTRPFDAKVIYKRVSNTIKLYTRQKHLISQVRQEKSNTQKNRIMLVEILSQILERPNSENHGNHASHMMNFTKCLLERISKKYPEYKLGDSEIVAISTASALHDIGKAGIDRKIIDKKGKLTDEEFDIIKTHTVLGENMLKRLKAYDNESLMKYAKIICRSHHERFDGNGYPDRLKGNETPLCAQVVSVCDVYDALISERSYKPAYTHEKAIEMIKNGECGEFNPKLLQCVEECAVDFKNIVNGNKTNKNGDE